jgi:Type II secretion system (T2SS), protein E, N-terminal domain
LILLGGNIMHMNSGVEKVDLLKIHFTPELLRCIPAKTARKYRVLPLFDYAGRLTIALAQADDLNVIDTLLAILKRKELEIRIAKIEQLDRFLQQL